MTLKWEDVEQLAVASFNIWTGQPELRWAKAAWRVLSEAGLTDYTTNPERCRVFARFMVLASFYRDWCAVAFDERQDDEVPIWLGEFECDPVHVGQALGPDTEVDDVDGAFETLMQEERSPVVATLLAGLGGEAPLFLSLWRSSEDPAEHEQNPGFRSNDDDEDEDDGDWAEPPQIDEDILNDPDEDKLAAYSWLSQGCDFLGPVRCRSDEL